MVELNAEEKEKVKEALGKIDNIVEELRKYFDAEELTIETDVCEDGTPLHEIILDGNSFERVNLDWLDYPDGKPLPCSDYKPCDLF